MRVALVHYSFWPVVGGVETVMFEHCRLFSEAGHEVTVFCEAGEAFARRETGHGEARLFRVEQLPAREADRDGATRSGPAWRFSQDAFEERFQALREFLVSGLADHDVVFIHNVCTMPFDLPLTAALWAATDALPETRFIGWVHDLAAGNPDYALGDVSRPPWNLLTHAHPRLEWIAVSEHRRRQFLQAFALPEEQCGMIPNGIDPLRQLRLAPEIERFALTHRLLERDLVLFHPTRLLRRKNVELSLQITAALRASGSDAALLVTGAADLYNPASVDYAACLHDLHDELGLARHAFFLADHFEVKPGELGNLYHLADALIFPSRHEGFGLPVLEAAFHRIPAFCADRAPFNAFPGAIPFDPGAAPSEIAATIMRHTNASPAIQARKRAGREFGWSAIWRQHLAPLLSQSATITPPEFVANP